jgi:hypothetical protein
MPASSASENQAPTLSAAAHRGVLLQRQKEIGKWLPGELGTDMNAVARSLRLSEDDGTLTGPAGAGGVEATHRGRRRSLRMAAGQTVPAQAACHWHRPDSGPLPDSSEAAAWQPERLGPGVGALALVV